MISKDLEIGVAFLQANQADLVAGYVAAMTPILGEEIAKQSAGPSLEGLISRLEGRPLSAARLEIIVTKALEQGQTVEKLKDASKNLLVFFRSYLLELKPEQLEPRIRDILLGRTESITSRHISNLELATMKIRISQVK